MNMSALDQETEAGFAAVDLEVASQSLCSAPQRPHAEKLREMNAMLEALARDLVEAMEADPAAVATAYGDLALSGHWRVEAAARSLLDRGIRAQYARRSN